MGSDDSRFNVSLTVTSHKTVSTGHNFSRKRTADAESNRGPPAYHHQPASRLTAGPSRPTKESTGPVPHFPRRLPAGRILITRSRISRNGRSSDKSVFSSCGNQRIKFASTCPALIAALHVPMQSGSSWRGGAAATAAVGMTVVLISFPALPASLFVREHATL